MSGLEKARELLNRTLLIKELSHSDDGRALSNDIKYFLTESPNNDYDDVLKQVREAYVSVQEGALQPTRWKREGASSYTVPANPTSVKGNGKNDGIVERVTYLTTLTKGWMGRDEGEPISAELGQRVVRILLELINNGIIKRPRIFPTPEGGIQVESDTKYKVLSVEFKPDMHKVACQVTELDGDDAYDIELDVGEDLTELSNWLTVYWG